MAVTVLPLILGAIADVFITSVNSDVGVSSRLSDSHDAQMTSAYFVRDVQSTETITTAATPTWCGSGNQVLGLEWHRTSGATAVVSYVIASTPSTLPPDLLRPAVTNPVALVRNYCSGTTTTNSVVAHDLSSAAGSALAVLSCNPNYGSCDSAAAAGPVSAGEVATVQIRVTDTSGYSYSLTGAPRPAVSTFSIWPPSSTPPTLLLLGAGTDVNCSGSGSGSLTVNGIAATDSSTSGSVSLGQNYGFTGAQIYSGSSSPVVTSGNTPLGYTTTSTQGTALGPPLPDPYANLPDPDTTHMPVYTTTNSLPGPGDYKNAVTLTNSITAPPGVYVFENGLSVGGNPTVTVSATGVLFFIGVPNAAPGTAQTASYNVSGNSTVNLTAMTSGTYQGVVIFQSRTDSNTLTIAGNGGSDSYGGVIYAPDASVDTSGNGSTATGGIISNSLACGGNGTVTVGSKVSTSTTIASTPSIPTTGQSVTFTATVVSNIGLSPLGSVTFTESPNGSSTPVTMCSAVNLVNGQASCTTSSLTASGSPYEISASYGGNANFQTSSTTQSQVVATGTTTTVTSNPPSPTTGQSVVLSAAVSPQPGTGTVTWSITFGSGGTLSCGSTTPLSGGTATCTISAGILDETNSPYTVSAVYSGSPGFFTSSGTLTLPVGSGSSTTSASVSPTSTTVGQSITDTTTVSGAGSTPTGQVSFYICTNATTGCNSTTGTFLVTEGLTGAGTATATYPAESAGNFCLAAYYLGDSNYAGSSDVTSRQCFTVGQAASVTTGSVIASSGSISQQFTDQAAISGPGPIPTGQVAFYVCPNTTTGCDSTTGSKFDTQGISGGTATSIPYTPSAPGDYCFAVYYQGDGNYSVSSDTTSDQCFTAG